MNAYNKQFKQLSYHYLFCHSPDINYIVDDPVDRKVTWTFNYKFFPKLLLQLSEAKR